MRIVTPALLAAILGASSAAAQTAPFTLTHPLQIDVPLDSTTKAAAFDVLSSGPGSGTNGPATAEDALHVGCQKSNWWNAQTVGEIDCVDINLRQGGPGSDGSGILVNAQNTGTGFVSDTEMVVSSVDTASNQLTHLVDIQQGVVNLGRDVYGQVYTADIGTTGIAVQIQAQGSAAWQWAIVAKNNAGTPYYTVDGQGNVAAAGQLAIAKGASIEGPFRATSTIVTPIADASGPVAVTRQACGTTLRSSASGPTRLAIPHGLPVGCRIEIIQAGAGTVMFEPGSGMSLEQLGIAPETTHRTAGRFALATILVDSPNSALLRGDLAGNPARPIALAADRISEPDDHVSIYK